MSYIEETKPWEKSRCSREVKLVLPVPSDKREALQDETAAMFLLARQVDNPNVLYNPNPVVTHRKIYDFYAFA